MYVSSAMGKKKVSLRRPFFRLSTDTVYLRPVGSIVKALSVRKRIRKRYVYSVVKGDLTTSLHTNI